MPGPGGRGPGLPLTVLEGPEVPSGYGGHCNSKGVDTLLSVTSAPLGQAKAPLAQGPCCCSPPLLLISPPSEQLVLPGKLPNEPTMRGLWRQSSKGRGLVPRARPIGHNTCRTPPPSRALPQRGKRAGVRAASTLLQPVPLLACCVVSCK